MIYTNHKSAEANTNKCSVQSGRDWVSFTLLSIAQTFKVSIKEWKWEKDESSPNEDTHYLVVAGKGKKRVAKVFSAWELSHCCLDHELQAELRTRLTKLLDFVR
jgi:hypothetical protein